MTFQVLARAWGGTTQARSMLAVVTTVRGVLGCEAVTLLVSAILREIRGQGIRVRHLSGSTERGLLGNPCQERTTAWKWNQRAKPSWSNGLSNRHLRSIRDNHLNNNRLTVTVHEIINPKEARL